MNKCLLGVNIDHIATIRQARFTKYPDLQAAAKLVMQAGADSITIHLREDRRHIQDTDVYNIKDAVTSRINLEMAVEDEIIDIACDVKPSDCCLVPEKRQELTTEGGLDVVTHFDKIEAACKKLASHNIRVSLFIDPVKKQLDAAKACNAPAIEIHTGHYASDDINQQNAEYEKIKSMAEYGVNIGLQVNAGHGLDYDNVNRIAAIPQISELNIGHSIVAQSIFLGLPAAVKEMIKLIKISRRV